MWVVPTFTNCPLYRCSGLWQLECSLPRHLSDVSWPCPVRGQRRGPQEEDSLPSGQWQEDFFCSITMADRKYFQCQSSCFNVMLHSWSWRRKRRAWHQQRRRVLTSSRITWPLCTAAGTRMASSSRLWRQSLRSDTITHKINTNRINLMHASTNYILSFHKLIFMSGGVVNSEFLHRHHFTHNSSSLGRVSRHDESTWGAGVKYENSTRIVLP